MSAQHDDDCTCPACSVSHPTVVDVHIEDYRPCECDVDGAVDADVFVRLSDGREVTGEITVCPQEGSRPAPHLPAAYWGAWGSPEHWASGELVALGGEALSAIDGMVDAAACEAVIAASEG